MSKKLINTNRFHTSIGKANSYYRNKNRTKSTRAAKVYFLNSINIRLRYMVDRDKLI
ncbi:hypothetical protein [Campylobacter canadensis]|uniref:Uncharacterized protein n=1 Tax=Campylobacter canadensis TaxID=449520 RepID=A0ABS7WRT0_9BACT|nr:hypothetical protein [Campylobacter canadensis]MBZ7987460.1 hypothetical protein [Campylobacter canadensis]MBZ7998655.1 hypothetical protein [Campylobacter canadensis]